MDHDGVAGPPPPPPPPGPPPPPPPPGSGTTRRRRGVRWGAADVLWVLLAQFVAATIAELAYRGAAGIPIEDDLSTSAFFWLVLPAGAAASIGMLVALSRLKGRGSLRADFGFEIRLRDATAVLGGLGWQIVLIIFLVPFALLLESEGPSQDLVTEIEETRAAVAWVAIVLGVVVVQPLVEEITFRGLLLRALLRRWSPAPAVAVSSAIFGVIHVFGTGFALDAIPTVVGLTGFGAVLAVQALRHDSLSRPILTHAGFNLTVVLLSLAA